MKILSLFVLLASVALADTTATQLPGVISGDNTGYLVKAVLIQHYSQLCNVYPTMGDKPGDGVVVMDEDVFHLDAKHFSDYVVMLGRELNGDKGR